MHYKWAYDKASKAFLVWPVDGPSASACPQHGDVLDSKQYETYYQGRISVKHGVVESFVIYEDRPFDHKIRSEAGMLEATAAVKDWSAWN